MGDQSHCVISSPSSSSLCHDDFDEFIMLLHVCEYDKKFLDQMSQWTSILSDEDFVMELLDDHRKKKKMIN